MSSSSCGVYPVTTMALPLQCSGHGQCLPSFEFDGNRSVCHCDAGWIGDSDFKVTTSLTDCHINVALLQAMWALFLAFHLVMGATRFLPKLRNLRASHRAKYGTQTWFCFSRKSGIFTVSGYLLLGYPAQFTYAVIKLARPEWNLGESVALTLLYSLWRITFYLSSTMFYTSLLSSILRSQRRFAAVLQRAYALSTLYTATILAMTLVPFIPLIAEVDPFAPVLGMVPVAVFLNVCALAMAYLAGISQYVRGHILRSDMFVALKSSVGENTENTQNPQRAQLQLLLKFANLMATSRNVAFSQAVLYAAFGCIPYLWNKHDYLLPFTWVPVVLVALNILTSLQTDEDERARQINDLDSGGGGGGGGTPQPHSPTTNTATHQQQQQQQQQKRYKENVQSTVVQSMDCESVVNVDVDSPALLATNARWKSMRGKNGGGGGAVVAAPPVVNL